MNIELVSGLLFETEADEIVSASIRVSKLTMKFRRIRLLFTRIHENVSILERDKGEKILTFITIISLGYQGRSIVCFASPST